MERAFFIHNFLGSRFSLYFKGLSGFSTDSTAYNTNTKIYIIFFYIKKYSLLRKEILR